MNTYANTGSTEQRIEIQSTININVAFDACQEYMAICDKNECKIYDSLKQVYQFKINPRTTAVKISPINEFQIEVIVCCEEGVFKYTICDLETHDIERLCDYIGRVSHLDASLRRITLSIDNCVEIINPGSTKRIQLVGHEKDIISSHFLTNLGNSYIKFLVTIAQDRTFKGFYHIYFLTSSLELAVQAMCVPVYDIYE